MSLAEVVSALEKRGITRKLGVQVVVGLLVVSLALIPLVSCSPKPTSLVIYSGRSETLVGPLIAEFEAATNIKVEVKYGGSGLLAAILLQEGEESPADIFFAQDPANIGAVDGLLTKIPPATLASVPNWSQSSNGNWVGVSGRLRTLAYNPAAVNPDELPDTIRSFTSSEWAGRIGWVPTNGSFQSMVATMRAVWGDAETALWIEGIVANRPTAYSNNTALVQGIADGEVDIGFTNHYYVLRLTDEFGDGLMARNNYFAAGDLGGIILATAVGILKTSNNQSAARQFVDYLLTTESQRYFVENTFEIPISTTADDELISPVPIEVTAGAAIASPTIYTDLHGVQNLLRAAGAIP